jgi:hypothetical protein
VYGALVKTYGQGEPRYLEINLSVTAFSFCVPIQIFFKIVVSQQSIYRNFIIKPRLYDRRMTGLSYNLRQPIYNINIFIKKINNYRGLYRVSQEECARLREGVPYVKVYRYNPKHLCPKFNFTEIMAREV